MWGAIIGAGASLIGGALNRRATKKTNRSNVRSTQRAFKQNQPDRQVAAWEKAGINPLFGLSKGQWIPKQASQSQVASMGDAFASAGSAFGQYLADKPEAELRATQLELQNELLKKELDKAVAPPVEPTALQRGEAIASPSLGDQPVVLGTPQGADPIEEGIPTLSNVADIDGAFYSKPSTKDASIWAERYGEWGEWIGAIHVALSDVDYNAALSAAADNSKYTVQELHEGFARGDLNIAKIIFPREQNYRAAPSVGDFNAGAFWGAGSSPQWPQFSQ